MAKAISDYRVVIDDLKCKNYKPVYFLMGDEPFYIDVIRDYIEKNVLSDAEKSFNQDVVYGSDTTTRDVINLAKGFPMGASCRVVIVKEAQNLRDLDVLSAYLKNPQKSTLLVFAYMKKADGRKKYVSEIEKSGGVLFESKPIYENQIPTFINNYFKSRKRNIDAKAVQLMADNIGGDLHKLVNESGKLLISIPSSVSTITADMVSEYVGISKQYNVYEFKDALVKRDVMKANTIAKYFAQNPKQNPIMPILSLLFNTFANLMVYYYLSDKSDISVSAALGISPYAVRDYSVAAKNYNGWQTMRIISEIRKCDAAAKGVDNSSASQGDLLCELVYHILHDKR